MIDNPFHYIALLDYERMGQTLFLKAMAKSMQTHRKTRGILLHADNARTENLLQTGIPRPEARLRVTRENNRRLVDLLAEFGVGSVAMNAWQLGTYDDKYRIREDVGSFIPPRTHLILSNQISRDGQPMALDELGESLAEVLGGIPMIAFSTRQTEEIFVNQEPVADKETMPAEFRNSVRSIQTWTMSDWAKADQILFH